MDDKIRPEDIALILNKRCPGFGIASAQYGHDCTQPCLIKASGPGQPVRTATFQQIEMIKDAADISDHFISVIDLKTQAFGQITGKQPRRFNNLHCFEQGFEFHPVIAHMAGQYDTAFLQASLPGKHGG